MIERESEGGQSVAQHAHNDQASFPMGLVCAADDKFSMGLAIALFSALKNYRGPVPVEIYVLDGGISPANKKRVLKVLQRPDVVVNWVIPPGRVLDDLPVKKRLATSTYLRLLIPDLLPSVFNRAIYLDADLLVQRNLAELWLADTGDNYLLASQDRKRLIANSQLARCPAIEFELHDEYFNNGVLLMNLVRIRNDDVGRKAIDFCRQCREFNSAADQDGLNAVALGRWGKLDPVWNWSVRETRDHASECQYRSDAVLHFMGASKPWMPWSRKFLKASELEKAYQAYDQYVEESGWLSQTERLWYRAKRSAAQMVSGRR